LTLPINAQSVSNIKLEYFKLSDDATKIALNMCKLEKGVLGDSYFDGNDWINITHVDVYILGWSKNGKMAYIENRSIDGRGGQDLYVTIRDLINDKNVWVLKVKYYDDEEGEGLTFEECVCKYAKQIDEALRINSIVVQPVAFRRLPIIYISDDRKTDEINVSVNIYEKGTDECGFQSISFKIEAINRHQHRKIITDERKRTVNIAVVTGYIQSPYENRVALVFASSRYVFEGSEMFLDFYGCNLDVGFLPE
jgi:hypothetical protein